MTPTGTQHVLRNGRFEAVVTEVGAHLRRLAVDGRDLLAPQAEDRSPVASQGAVLCPWPNRVRDGRYPYEGRTQQLPITEVARSNAIHGLLAWVGWRVVAASESALTLEADVWPQPGYPFRLLVSSTYELSDDGLLWTIRARNEGAGTAPYGVSVHPYLVPGPGTVDDWSIVAPGATCLTADDRLLPTGEVPVGPGTDLREGAALAGLVLDRSYHGLADGRARVLAADGSGVELVWDPQLLPWLQVFTTDIDVPFRRAAVAVEPMSCPADAFNSGTDVVRLAPGDEHEAWWRIRPV